jgi:hypothetical protein
MSATPTMQGRTEALQQAQAQPRADVLALWGGILFSLVFTGIIWLAGGWLRDVPLGPDQGVSWYYWKLPEPTFWTRLSVWGLYFAHQLSSFAMIWYAQKYIKRYSNGLHGINKLALAVNALFIGLHFVQTHIWYDGLAQDVSIFTSQGSVIVLLVWVLLMENRDCAGCEKVSWLFLFVGNHLHLLVPSNGIDQWASDWFFLYVYVAFAGQFILHTYS